MIKWVVLILIVVPRLAWAGLSARPSYLVWSQDRKTFLAIVSDAAISKDGGKTWVSVDPAPTATLPDGRQIDLHKDIPGSGLYDAASLTLLWHVNWYVFECDLFTSPDLRYIAKFDRLRYPKTAGITFLDQGVQTKSYAANQLLTSLNSHYFLHFSSWDWHEVWYDDVVFEGDGKTISLSTARRRFRFCDMELDLGLQEFYTFDLQTGEMLTKKVSGRWVRWAYIGSAAALLISMVCGIRWLWRKLQRLRAGRGFPVELQAMGVD